MRKFLSLLTISLLSLSYKPSKAETAMKPDSKISVFSDAGYKFDTFATPAGRIVNLIFIKHGSLAIEVDGFLTYIDPVAMFGNDFSVLPKADLVLITHEHHDHLEPETIATISDASTRIISSPRVSELFSKASPVEVGNTVNIDSAAFSFFTVPAYNITPEHLNYHPRSRGDLGFLFNIDGLIIYVAGDTEDIPEMESLSDLPVDIAFLPVNQPFTMTPQQAIHAVEMIKPRIVYPYHYGQTDLTPLIERFAASDTDVRIRQMQ